MDAHPREASGARRDRFLDPDQLDAQLSRLHDPADGRTRLDEIGSSRLGRPLRMLSIGRGDRHAVVVGTPHPNEPTGGLGALRLAEQLLGDTTLLDGLGLVWHLVPCADPDGMWLNRDWFAGPHTYAAYGASLYRPPFPEQFEWTFHRPELELAGLPPIPESTAVMRLVDDVRPELFVSMHNAEVGGSYCYVTQPVASLGSTLASLRTTSGVPVYGGEPEVPAEQLAPGVFHVPPALEGGHHLCSTDYAARYGALGVTTEPPLWADARGEDQREISVTRAEVAAAVARSRAEVHEQHADWVDVVQGELDLDTVRGRAVHEDGAGLERTWPTHDQTAAGPASTAYATSLRHTLDLDRVRAAGHVVALLRSEPAAQRSPALLGVLESATARLRAWADEATRGTTFVGLDGAVRCHVAITLAGAASLAGS